MNIIDEELNRFNKILMEELSVIPPEISLTVNQFISAKSKKIRPSLIFLFANAMDIKITDAILKLAVSVEIIHNATLIHDDIIDDAKIRRGRISLNKELGNNLSVLTGDILLSVAMKNLSSFGNIEIIDLFSLALQKMCIGEINQNSSLNKLPSYDEYINKSKNKTAELFLASLEALCILENLSERQYIKDFALNYGIAFQIRDDLNNILKKTI